MVEKAEVGNAVGKVFGGLSNVQALMAKESFKKSGYNSYSKYHFFELSDFLPKGIEFLAKNKLATYLTIEGAEAKLYVVHADDASQIVISVPFVPSELKGAQSIQNLGSSLTYIRRYLYIILFELVETETIDREPANYVAPVIAPIAPAAAPIHIQEPNKWAVKVSVPPGHENFQVLVIAGFKVYITMARVKDELNAIYLANKPLYDSLNEDAQGEIVKLFEARKQQIEVA